MQQTGLFGNDLTDYRIYQRGAHNTADIPASGNFPPELAGTFTASLVNENTGAPVAPQFDSFTVQVDGTGRWEYMLRDVPAGGPYRFETRARVGYEFPAVHHLCVGDVWVIAGQSNAGGFTSGTVEDPPEFGVHMYTRAHGWAPAAHPLGDGFGHSPFLHFAKRLKRELGVPVGLVPVAVGGSPLSDWNPDEGDAPLYRRMMDALHGIGCGVRGMAWYQGCSDTDTEEHAQRYGERFCGFVRHLRRDTGIPDLPVIVAQLNRWSADTDEAADRRWSAVREQQRILPEMLPGCGVVPAIDLSLSDAIHTSAEGNIKLGERFANAALGMVYGRDILWQAPDIFSAEADCSATRIRLRFSHVPRGTNGVSSRVRDFTVEDGGGFIPLSSVEAPNDGTVTLILSRPSGADAVVHCGFGADPVHTIRRAGDVMPLLCFYRFAISGLGEE